LSKQGNSSNKTINSPQHEFRILQDV